jgi:recombination DNA repair RAD52 pathway protein
MEADQLTHRLFSKRGRPVMEKHTTELDLTKLYEALRATDRLEGKALELCNEAVKLLAKIMEVTRELKATIDAAIDLEMSERSTASDDNANKETNLKTLERSTASDDNANKDFYDPDKDSQHLAASL